MLLNDFDTLNTQLLSLAEGLRARHWRLSCAESCTGGLIAALCTSIAGSSDWFERGFVTYSNAAKRELLGVPAAVLGTQGAVSEPVARAMALGALAHSAAQVAMAVTGIAGPGGAVPGKPVGTVWLGVAWQDAPDATPHCETYHLQLPGDRTAVRSATVSHALAHVQALLTR